jgi:hypothetical protein
MGGDIISPSHIQYYRRIIMAKNLSKIVAVISASAIAVSMAPMAFADVDDVEENAVEVQSEVSENVENAAIEVQSAVPDDNGVYYDEDFSGFSGTIINMTSGSNTADYSETNGMTFSCRTREGDQAQQGITASKGVLTLFANKYTASDQVQPTISLSWTSGVNFTADRVMTLKMKYGTATSQVLISDSSDNGITLSLPSGAKTSEWITYTIASMDSSTAIIAQKEDGTLLSYSSNSTVLTNFASISAPKALVFNFAVDSLKIEDVDYAIPDSIVLEAAMSSLSLTEGQLGMTSEDGYYLIKNDISLPSDPDGTTVEWKLSQRKIDNSSAAWEDTAFASVEDGKLIVAPTSDSADYYVKATAVVTAGSESATKEFMFVVKAILDTDPIEYYNEDFSGFTTGTLVSVQATASGASNSSYSSKGFAFSCGTRASGGSGETGISIATESSANYLSIFATKYDDDGSRTPVVELTNTEGITIRSGKRLVFNADVKFTAGSTTSGMILKDTSDAAVTFTGDAGTWYNVTYVFGGDSGERLVKDASGNIIDYASGLSNLSDIKYITIPSGNSGYCNIKNLSIIDKDFEITDEEIVSAIAYNLNMDTTQDEVIANSDSTYTAINDFKLPTSSISGGDITWAVTQNGGEATEFATVSNGKIITNPSDGIEDNTYTATATIKYGEAEATKEFTFKIQSPKSIVEAAAANVALAYADSGAPKYSGGVYTVTKDLALQTTGDSTTTVTWATSDSKRVTASGVIYPNDSDENVTLTATVSFRGEETTKEFVVSIPNAITSYIDPIIAALTVSNADDTTVTYPVDKIGTVATDIKLPTTITSINGKTFDGSVKIDWTVESDNASLNDNVVEYLVSDFDEHEVKLTATLTYVKNDKNVLSKTTETYTYKVQFPENAVASDDTVYDKYKARMDAAYDANFSSIPTSASSSITLPTTGHFGSKFTWNSSIPTTISNTGAYTKPSTSKNVVLTASVMSGSASEEKSFNISVAGSSSSSSGGGGGGGGSTSSTGTTNKGSGSGTIVTNTTTSVPYTSTNAEETVEKLKEEAASANDLFTDIGDASWAREAINGLASAGVVNGKTDTLFAPNDTVTRAEFAKMLMGAFGLTANTYTTSSFKDVSTDAWYFSAVETAYNLGIINGVDDGVFAPNALITRQDMAVMVSRAAAINGTTISETSEGKTFADDASISSYAKNAVNQLVKGGIINGISDTEFAPLSNATRAQAAKILYSFL